MDSIKDDNTKWIHLLFRGDRPSQGSLDQQTCDDYVKEFSGHEIVAATVPLLEFKFKNLDKLAKLLEDSHNWEVCKGLIITSPRVVDALVEAEKLISDERKDSFWWDYKSDLIYVVGERTSSECEKKLKLTYNPQSPKTGDGRSLAKFIKASEKEHNFRQCNISLCYPKSSLADNTIEDELADMPNLKVESVVVYETHVINNVETAIIEKLKEVNIPDSGTSKLLLNMIFFSPSGVNGFLQIDQNNFLANLKRLYPESDIELHYSSIGKTTEAALLKNNLNVFCVSSKPNPTSLVKSILMTVDREYNKVGQIHV